MTLALIAALPSELKPLVRGWRKSGSLYTGRIGDRECVATAAGMGAKAATRSCESALASESITAFISIGYAGALSCGLQVGSAYPVREVIDAVSGERFLTDIGEGQCLITLSTVAGPQEKRRLGLEHKAVMVDMEAAAVARFARSRNLGFYCWKGITDGPNDHLPDFGRFTGPDGQLRLPAFLAWAALHPHTWPQLRRLAASSRLAAEQLAQALSQGLTGSP